MIGQLETAQEAAFGDAAMQEFAFHFALFRRGLATGNGQQAVLGLDLQVVLAKAGNGDLDGKFVISDAFNIVRRIALGAIQTGGAVNHVGHAVKANHGAIKGGQINRTHLKQSFL